MIKIPYLSVVGCAMVLTRLDLSYVASVVNKFMANPRKEHWKAIVWILRYLAGTTDYGFMYGADRTTIVYIEGYVDANYTRDLDQRRSLTGFCLS